MSTHAEDVALWGWSHDGRGLAKGVAFWGWGAEGTTPDEEPDGDRPTGKHSQREDPLPVDTHEVNHA